MQIEDHGLTEKQLRDRKACWMMEHDIKNVFAVYQADGPMCISVLTNVIRDTMYKMYPRAELFSEI